MSVRRSPFCRIVFFSAFLLSAGTQGTFAHPLGNDSITHFSVLYVLPDRLEVDFLLDIAETQSVILRRDEIDADKDETDTPEEQQEWLDHKAAEFQSYLTASVDGHALKLEAVDVAFDPKTGKKASASRLILKLPGNLGLPTYRLMIRYVAKYPEPLEPGQHELTYEDRTYPDLSGLSRIILERTTALTELPEEHAKSLAGGELSNALRVFVETKRFTFGENPDLITIDPGRRWQIHTDGTNYAIVTESDALRLYRLPRIEFIPPRPIFWDEGIDPFLYEQYDPGDLPEERQATIQFKVIDAVAPEGFAETAKPDTPAPPAPLPAEPSAEPANHGAATVDPTGTEPDTEIAPDSDDEHTAFADASTAAIAEADEELAGLPAYVDSFTSPANDPSRTESSYKQANLVIAMLRGDGDYSEQSFFLVMALLTMTAFGWGAAHALMPGHAKTVVAAYLISQKGTYWHAVLLAIVVTITHTALVVIVGLTIWAYKETYPGIGPALQNWLGVIAGLLVAGMGAFLGFRALTGRLVHHHHDHDHDHHHDEARPWWKKLFTHSHPHVPGVGHAHDHDHVHAHGHSHGHTHKHDHGHEHHHEHSHGHEHQGHSHSHDHSHDHPHHDDHHHHPHDHQHPHDYVSTVREATPINARQILVLGISGGIVPCPTATIIVLLGLGANVMFGALYTVGVFSLGLALTLMMVGFLALSSRKFAARIFHDAQHEGEPSSRGQWLMYQAIPAVSAMVVILLGLAIAANYYHFMQTGRALFSWLG